MNRYLTGNGVWCSKCDGSGHGEVSDSIEYENGSEFLFYNACAACNGQGRLEVKHA